MRNPPGGSDQVELHAIAREEILAGILVNVLCKTTMKLFSEST
jgi:hypothetical protein